MRGMSMDNILGDPFALATISIAVVRWKYPHFTVPHFLHESLLT
jgi:hypothetical protein